MVIFHTAHLRAHEEAVLKLRDRLLRHAHICLETEPGCHRFDIYQDTKDSSLFLLIEIYADEAAFEAHRSSEHYLQFREDVKNWVAERTWWYWNKIQAGTR